MAASSASWVGKWRRGAPWETQARRAISFLPDRVDSVYCAGSHCLCTPPYSRGYRAMYGTVYMEGTVTTTSDAVECAIGTRQIPESVRSLSSFPDIDYADHFSLATDAPATPERWARAMFGDVPSVGELVIWRA